MAKIKIINITVISLSIVIFLLQSCQEDSSLSEGELVYNITYPQEDKKQPIIALLPKQMSVYFKNNKTAGYINGFWGTFEIRFINDYKKQKSYTIVRIVNKKYIYTAPSNDLPPGYSEMKKIKIVAIDKDTTIANLHCKTAIMYTPIYSTPETLYYTYDIDIKDPNANNPFKDIKGVLVKFKVRLLGIDMIFHLKEVKNHPIEDKKFQIPQEYQAIEKKELEKFLKNFTQ